MRAPLLAVVTCWLALGAPSLVHADAVTGAGTDAVTGSESGSDSDSDSGSDSGSDSDSVTDSGSGSDSVGDALAAEATAPSTAPQPAETAAQNAQRELERSLAAVRSEREDTNLVLPWIVTATGAAVVVAGLVLGAHAALSCRDSCSASGWPGWLVIGGGVVGEAGMIWVLLKDRDVAELELRERQLESELERLHWNAPRASGAPQASFTLHRSF
jgi:hypothetical protein